MSVGSLGVVNYRSNAEKTARGMKQTAREAKKTRMAVTAEAAAAAQAHAAEAAAWQAQAAATQHQQTLAHARWVEEQNRMDARAQWYADPSALEACHHCGAPRHGVPMDAACGYCSTPQRQRYFDGSSWTEHTR